MGGSWKNEGDEPTDVIVFQLNADLLHHLYDNKLTDWFLEDKAQKSSSTVKLVRHELIDNYYTALKSYFNMPKFFTEEVIQSKIRKLISLLAITDLSNEARKIFGNLFNATEYEFQETIAKNIFEDLTIEDLTFLTGMSLSSFKGKFKDIFENAGDFVIGPEAENWDFTLLIEHQLVDSFMAFAQDAEYLKTAGHRTASPSDSRLLPITQEI